MKRSDIFLALASLLLFILPAKVMLLGEAWTWLAALNGIAGVVCAAVATSSWQIGLRRKR